MLSLVREAQQREVALQVVVIGTMDAADASTSIVQTGTYEPDALCRLLTEHRVHMALIPSICPETFSFVTHELMQLEVPLMCFNLGAQADAVCVYEKGCVVPLGSAQELLRRMQEFKVELDNRNLA